MFQQSTSQDLELKQIVNAPSWKNNGIFEPKADNEVLRDKNNIKEKNAPTSGFWYWRSKIFVTLSAPESSKLALLVTLFVMLWIVISTVTFCLESLPKYYKNKNPSWFIIETIAVCIFTVEYVGRLLTCPKLVPFLISPLNVVDFVAILPYWIEQIFGAASPGVAVIRVIRLARVLRIFKLGRNAEGLQLVARSLKRSLDGLYLLSFFLSLAVVVFSSMIYYAEQTISHFKDGEWVYEDGTKTPFQSIPHTFWWCIVTMTTVGYGDAVPISLAGKLVASLTILCGILIIAFPIAILSSKFLDVYNEHNATKSEEKKSKGTEKLPEHDLLPARVLDLMKRKDKLSHLNADLGCKMKDIMSHYEEFEMSLSLLLK